VLVDTQVNIGTVLGSRGALSSNGALGGALVTTLLEGSWAVLGQNSHGEEGQDEDGEPREVHVACRLQGNIQTILITTNLISSGPHSGPFSPNTC